MADILTEILRTKRTEVEALKVAHPLQELRREPIPLPRILFKDAISRTGTINIIAELKQRSPSKGPFVPSLNPGHWATRYQQGGAAALSVLTDEAYFGGRLEYLAAAKRAASLPVLCKDFVIDIYQIHYARFMGADAVLLIVRALSPEQLKNALAVCGDLGLDALVEAHDENEIDIALTAGAAIIGINSRDLKDFSVSLDRAIELGRRIPAKIVSVAESGIATIADIKRLQQSGYRAFLVGEALMTAPDPVGRLRALRGETGGI